MATEWVVQAAGSAAWTTQPGGAGAWTPQSGSTTSWVIVIPEIAETVGGRILLEGGGGFLLLQTGGRILLAPDDDPGDVADDPIPTWTPQGAASPTWTEQ